MFYLLKIEWLKVKPYRVFWIVFGLYMLSIPLTFWAVSKINFVELIKGEDAFQFPFIWHRITWMIGAINFFLGLIIILNVGPEFTNRTARQNVIDGLSIKEWLFAKIQNIVILTLISSLVIGLLILIFGSIYSSDYDAGDMFSKSYFIGLHILRMLVYLSFILFLVLLLRKTVIAIIVFLAYMAINGVVVGLIHVNLIWMDYLPLGITTGLIHRPYIPGIDDVDVFERFEPTVVVSLAVLYIIAFNVGSYFILKRRNL